MLRWWFSKVASPFVLAGLLLNVVALLLRHGSFAPTLRNWSLAISVSLVGIVLTGVATIVSLWRPKSQ